MREIWEFEKVVSYFMVEGDSREWDGPVSRSTRKWLNMVEGDSREWDGPVSRSTRKWLNRAKFNGRTISDFHPGTEAQLKIYCDTSTLPHNIRHADQKSQGELAALKQLAEKYSMFSSLVALRELMNTTKQTQRDYLIVDYEALEPIPKDEMLLGFYTQTDQYGGFITNPLISDVQDERVRAELTQHGLKLRDAEHITQAVCNGCDVFLTRDERTIITPHRAWLERRFPTLKVRLPSELLADLARR